MKNEFRFAFYAIKKNIQGSAELRVSFLTNIFGMMINNTAFVFLWIAFVRSVGEINGWTAVDVIGLQGFAALSFGIVFSVGSGLRKTAFYVADGSFDRFLVSPKNSILRVATSSFNASGVGDIIFGIVCLLFFCFLLNVTSLQMALLFVLIICSVILLVSVMITVSSLSFLFTDPTTVAFGLFDFFMTPALFHGGAFQGVLRFLYTFIIPSLLLGSLPVETIRTLSISKLLIVVGITAVWFMFSLKMFAWGVKRYESSSLMSFGS